jgi:hypothetical protein
VVMPHISADEMERAAHRMTHDALLAEVRRASSQRLEQRRPQLDADEQDNSDENLRMASVRDASFPSHSESTDRIANDSLRRRHSESGRPRSTESPWPVNHVVFEETSPTAAVELFPPTNERNA